MLCEYNSINLKFKLMDEKKKLQLLTDAQTLIMKARHSEFSLEEINTVLQGINTMKSEMQKTKSKTDKNKTGKSKNLKPNK